MDDFSGLLEQDANQSDPASAHELNRSFGYFWNGKSIWGAVGDAIEIGKINRAPNNSATMFISPASGPEICTSRCPYPPPKHENVISLQKIAFPKSN